jgi:hypothetical protein
MKFVLTVKHKRSNLRWPENYDIPEIKTAEEAERWARATIHRFNDTLRPGEQPREYVSVALVAQSEKHAWTKTNLVTLSDARFGMYDRMECAACKITGKRFGLSSSIKVDRKFKSTKYKRCYGKPVTLEKDYA